LYENAFEGLDIQKNIFQDIRVFLSLYDEIEKNPEHIKTLLKENPFLVEAVGETSRFGVKILTSFPQFDNLAKKRFFYCTHTRRIFSLCIWI
jgi:hypothetical protein